MANSHENLAERAFTKLRNLKIPQAVKELRIKQLQPYLIQAQIDHPAVAQTARDLAIQFELVDPRILIAVWSKQEFPFSTPIRRGQGAIGRGGETKHVVVAAGQDLFFALQAIHVPPGRLNVFITIDADPTYLERFHRQHAPQALMVNLLSPEKPGEYIEPYTKAFSHAFLETERKYQEVHQTFEPLEKILYELTRNPKLLLIDLAVQIGLPRTHQSLLQLRKWLHMCSITVPSTEERAREREKRLRRGNKQYYTDERKRKAQIFTPEAIENAYNRLSSDDAAGTVFNIAGQTFSSYRRSAGIEARKIHINNDHRFYVNYARYHKLLIPGQGICDSIDLQIINLRYPRNDPRKPTVRPLSQAKVGEKLNMTKQAVSQREQAIMARIKARIHQ